MELIILKDVVVTGRDERPLVVLRPSELVQAVVTCDTWAITKPKGLCGLQLARREASPALIAPEVVHWLAARGQGVLPETIGRRCRRGFYRHAVKAKGPGQSGQGGRWRVPLVDLEEMHRAHEETH